MLLRAHILTAALTLVSLPALAQTAAGTPADTDAIKSVVQSQADAWNKGDAQAFAARYAEDGSFTNVIGQQIYGKQGFIAQHAMLFSSIYKGSHNSFTVTHVKFVRSDVAVVDIDGTLTGATHMPPGIKPDPDGATRVKLQEVMSKESGQWQIQAFHNVIAMQMPGGPPPSSTQP